MTTEHDEAVRLCRSVGILVAENSEQPGLDVRKAAALVADVSRNVEREVRRQAMEECIGILDEMDCHFSEAATLLDAQGAIRARLDSPMGKEEGK